MVEHVLHVHLWTQQEPQHSLCEALADLGSYTQVAWPTLSKAERSAAVLDALATPPTPTLVFMQLQTPDVLTREALEALRAHTATIVSWCGDVGRDPQWSLDVAPYCDLMLFSSKTQAAEHRAHGVRQAEYLQIGYEEGHHYPGPAGDYGSLYDVVFAGQNYTDAHWNQWMPDHEAQLRRDMVRAFTASGLRFGLFGQSWGYGVPLLSSEATANAMRRAHLALSISLTSKLEAYSSDRLLRALACGTPVLVKQFHGMDSWGLVDGVNCAVWNTVQEALELARAMLAWPREKLRALGLAGAKLAKEQHTWPARMTELRRLVGIYGAM